MKTTTRLAIAAATLLAATGACPASPLDAARERFSSACAEDVSRLCSVRHLGGGEAEVRCAPMTAATAAPACVAAYDALKAEGRR